MRPVVIAWRWRMAPLDPASILAYFVELPDPRVEPPNRNEPQAIPCVLDALALAGCVVPIDAKGGQPAIARQIVDRGADSLLARKDNQPALHELVADHSALVAADAADPTTARRTTIDKGH